jgi:hypothetical protein
VIDSNSLLLRPLDLIESVIPDPPPFPIARRLPSPIMKTIKSGRASFHDSNSEVRYGANHDGRELA